MTAASERPSSFRPPSVLASATNPPRSRRPVPTSIATIPPQLASTERLCNRRYREDLGAKLRHRELLVRSIDWHPDLGAERTRPRALGIWVPLIDPQHRGTGERGTQIFGPSVGDLPEAELPLRATEPRRSGVFPLWTRPAHTGLFRRHVADGEHHTQPAGVTIGLDRSLGATGSHNPAAPVLHQVLSISWTCSGKRTRLTS